ncbi:hypothetical protein Q7P37_011188 [Cladosporium fusiforme]
MSEPYLRNVIIVGAGGQVGGQIVQQLLAEGKHKVTALTRPDSSSSMPPGINSIQKVDYDQPDQLAAAMSGQDVLIITMGAIAPASSSLKLIDAAATAGVKYIVPNEWGTDRAQVQIGKDMMLAEGQIKICQYIESKGLNWISIGCGFWYEFSLSGMEARFGFDFTKRNLTWFDDGNTKITVTTWPQTALGLARVLALPLESSSGPSISKYGNGQTLVSSFLLSQRDVLDSVLRVTGGKEDDWTFTNEEVKSRFARGMQMLQKGDFDGFTIAMYSRAFFPDDAMVHEAKVANAVLDLPKEDLDEATKVAIQMAPHD